ncbi:ShlB/FhaC/HecB family hemolysin secretion/activation protein [Oxalobacteraceae bacterium OM1]|nr:ShlB/FhaC/HecB family hemolysin secretion/activation protein [Oxalobacteraceae bacterium OM1]
MARQLFPLLAGAALAMLSVTARAADDDAGGIGRFDINGFKVEGNTLLPQPAIDQAVTPYVGKRRDFGDVQKALESLEQVYHRLGYNVVVVTLPEQELDKGVVTLRVVETRLGKLKVEGNQYFSEANIRRSLPMLREGATPNIGKASSSLKLANENPAKKVALQLQSGANDDEVDATLKVTDEKPWKIGAAVDNTGTSSTGKSHLTVQYQHANIADLDHVLSLQYTTTIEKPSQVSVYGAGYHIPLYSLGDSIDVFASYSDVDSGSVSAGIFDLLVSGRGTIAGARYNQNLRRIGDYESKLIYGVDYRAYQNNVTLAGVQLGNDVTVHPLSVAYAGLLGMPGGEASFSVTAMHNVAGGSRGGAADFTRVRSGARADYNLLRYTAGYTRLLPQDWQLRLNLSGQLSNDALVPGEQFGAGGASSVRGFQERDISSDSGYLVNAEVYTPNVCGAMERFAMQCRALAFYDSAYVSRNKALPGEQASASIGSVGVGMRVNADKYLALQLDVGHVVDGGVTQAKGDNRMHFRLSLSY